MQSRVQIRIRRPMARSMLGLVTLGMALLLLASCGAVPGTQEAQMTPSPTSSQSSASYPKSGHAPDYSWVAGQVAFTKIQGGCVFVRAGDESFSPNGQSWQDTKVNDKDYVVIFGHIAGTGDVTEVCPGGKAYIVDKVMLNP